jgi:hypothetical protein
VKLAQILSQRPSGKGAADPLLEKRIQELEQRLAEHMEISETREVRLGRIEEKVEFTERLLDKRLPGSS